MKHLVKQKKKRPAIPLYIFLTGGAWTGKSHTIECIHFIIIDRSGTRTSETANWPIVLLLEKRLLLTMKDRQFTQTNYMEGSGSAIIK